MGKSCVWRPRVRNKEGELSDSILFDDIRKIAPDRSSCVRLWNITRTGTFRDQILPGLETDINGEPTIESMIENIDMEEFFPQEYIEKTAQKDTGKKDDTFVNRQAVSRACATFNRESPFRSRYVAMPRYVGGSVELHLERKTEENAVTAVKMERNTSLNTQLMELLGKWGVGIDALSEVEEAMGINGVMEYDQAMETAKGLVAMIRLAKGERGEEAFPEEFSHFFIRAFYDNPLVQRLLNTIDSHDLVHEVLGDEYEMYHERYGGDRAKLVEECAGKLLARHLLDSQKIPQEKPYKNILQRAIAAIKAFFRKLSETEVEKAMREADGTLDTLTRQILNKKILNEKISVSRIREATRLFNLTIKDVATAKTALEKSITAYKKIPYIFRNPVFLSWDRNNPNKSGTSQFLEDMERAYDLIFDNGKAADDTELTDNQIKSLRNILTGFLTNLGDQMADLKGAITNEPRYYSRPVNEQASLLRDVMNIIRLFHSVYTEYNILEEDDNLKKVFNNLNVSVTQLERLIIKMQRDLFSEYIKPYSGSIRRKRLVVTGEPQSEDDILDRLEEDLSWGQRWLDSAADSSSDFLKIIDQIVKKAKNKARLMTTQHYQKKILAASAKLRKAGITDFEWMFERDEEGKKTGYYLSRYDYGRYLRDYRSKRDSLQKLVDDGKMTVWQANGALGDWRDTHFDKDAMHPKDMYLSAEFKYQMSDPAKKEYYDTIMKIKEELDKKIPNPGSFGPIRRIVMIRKGLMERVARSKSVSEGKKQIWEAMKDEVVRRGDDIELGTDFYLEEEPGIHERGEEGRDKLMKPQLTGFDGEKILLLPVFYTRLREGEDVDDMSSDVASTMIAFAAMACEYEQMNKVVDILETGRDIAYRIKVNNKIGNKFRQDTSSGQIVTKREGSSLFWERLNDYFTMQVYGRYMSDAEVAGMSTSKIAHLLNKITSLRALALNLLAGISNATNGISQMNLEVAAGQFVTAEDLLLADKAYASHLPSFLGEIGKRLHTSKLYLFDELFNVLQDYEVKSRDFKFDRKNRLLRTFGWNALFFINTGGEHWLQNRTALALAMHYKLRDASGLEINLWDALETVPVDPDDPTLGKRIRLKSGVRKLDGTEFGEEDIYKFTRRAAALNQRMHGIYNNIDKNASQRTFVGILVHLFRKWIRPSYNRRFRKYSYNYDLDADTEGYYRSLTGFMRTMLRQAKMHEMSLAAIPKDTWNKMEDYKKQNVVRAVTEMATVAALYALSCLIGSGPDDDDDDYYDSWGTQMAAYQIQRLYTELASLTPSPGMLNEALKIVKSPAAAINTLEDATMLFQLVNPNSWYWYAGEDAIVEKGQYKGLQKGEKYFWNLIPLNRTIWRDLNPEEASTYYKN